MACYRIIENISQLDLDSLCFDFSFFPFSFCLLFLLFLLLALLVRLSLSLSLSPFVLLKHCQLFCYSNGTVGLLFYSQTLSFLNIISNSHFQSFAPSLFLPPPPPSLFSSVSLSLAFSCPLPFSSLSLCLSLCLSLFLSVSLSVCLLGKKEWRRHSLYTAALISFYKACFKRAHFE